MRTRLRPGRGDAEELEFYSHRYPHGYTHQRWPDHVERVAASVDFIQRHTADLVWTHDTLVADLSCGDAAIAGGVQTRTGCRLLLGDLIDGTQADPYGGLDAVGPLEHTAFHLRDGGADLLICSETLEHLNDPEAILRLLRPKTARLFVSTPLGETTDDNPEHYWGWDAEGIHDLLLDTGWSPVACEKFTPEFAGSPYTFQFWMCR